MNPKTTDARPLIRPAIAAMLILALWIGGLVDGFASPAAPNASLTQSDVESLALNWFERMRKGEIDRGQLTSGYSRQLTAEAVQELAKFLQTYEYAAAPLGAQVLLKRSSGAQTFYIVKIVFPRGDAASLMFGFNEEGKITGINLMSMAGD
jgi:hypothetical protein